VARRAKDSRPTGKRETEHAVESDSARGFLQQQPARRDRLLLAAVCGLLLLAVFVIFAQTVRHDFVNIDDDDYVSGNRYVRGGLSAANASWAFTTRRASHWHPLTWLSLMLDAQLFGADRPGRFHLTNVLLHAACAIVLFLGLKQMTRQLWPSALVAGLFAVHPARVESVAWITERKDVLSGLFGMAALWAYGWYVRRPSVGRYLLVAVLLALGLMAKPTLVTWPLLFLLLDYWPLQRPITVRLITEKVPLLMLVAASAVVTYYGQSSTNSVMSLATVPLTDRIARAAILYFVYLGKTFWPVNLAIYPADALDHVPWGWPAAVLLVLITIAAIWAARRGWRWLAVGWLWYLIALTPTIGLVQVGLQLMADRFLYLPQIGLCIAVVWSAAQCFAASGNTSRATLRACSIVAVSLVLAVLGVTAWRQTTYWKDSETLWTRALDCTPRNPLALAGLGSALLAQGDADAAIGRCEAALQIDPQLLEAHYNLGLALASGGRHDDAIAQFRAALSSKPDFAKAHFNLASELSAKGGDDAAIAEYQEALNLVPDYAEAHNNLATLLARRREIDAAVEHFEQALKLEPELAKIHYNYGNALAGAGRLDAAIGQYEEAIRIQPDHANARHNLAAVQAHRQEIIKRLAAAREKIRATPNDAGLLIDVAWILATNPNVSIRNGADALILAQRAVKIAGPSAARLDTLAAAYAEAGQFDDAVATARQAEESAVSEKNPTLARVIHSRLEWYIARAAFRESQ
jgi:tetratricopeptide (TPR) repeat protein